MGAFSALFMLMRPDPLCKPGAECQPGAKPEQFVQSYQTSKSLTGSKQARRRYMSDGGEWKGYA